MRKKTDSQKIEYITQVSSKYNVSSYQKKIAKKYLQELYDEAIQNHNRFSTMYDSGLITKEDCITFQNNVILFIKVLKVLNRKHNLVESLV